jgi:hypothetical protein
MAHKASPCTADRRLRKHKSVARSSSDIVMGMICGLPIAVSSVTAHLFTVHPSRTSFNFLTRTTSAHSPVRR